MQVEQLLPEIQKFLRGKGVYNCLVEVDGARYRLNLTLGAIVPGEDDLGFPKYDCPESIATAIRTTPPQLTYQQAISSIDYQDLLRRVGSQ